MPFLTSLTDRCDVVHGTTTLDSQRRRVPTYDKDNPALEDQRCLLVPQFTQADRDVFGTEVVADGVLHMMPGVDLRPKPEDDPNSGQPDLIKVTDGKNGNVTWWHVVRVHDPGGQARATRAAVKLDKSG